MFSEDDDDTKNIPEPVAGISREALNKLVKEGFKYISKRGKYMRIHKSKINVDEAYQRTNISMERVRRYAADWNYMAAGTLTIARRIDGSLWAVDGQHRKLAADRVDEIQELDCMVFDVSAKAEEADGFVRINSGLAVPAFNKYNAKLVANDPIHVEVQKILQSVGLEPVHAKSGANKWYQLRCIKAVITNAKDSLIDTHWCLYIAANLAKEADETIHVDVLKGLFTIQKRGVYEIHEGIDCIQRLSTSSDLRDRIFTVGVAKIRASITRKLLSESKENRNPKIFADGLLSALNYHRRQSQLYELAPVTSRTKKS